MPWVVVFQTPPAAAATYQVSGDLGSTATSTTRPEVTAGPMPRNARPANVPALNGSLFASSFFFVTAVLAAPACVPLASRRASMAIQTEMVFTEILQVPGGMDSPSRADSIQVARIREGSDVKKRAPAVGPGHRV